MARWSRMFDGNPEAIGQARGFARTVLDGHALADDAELVISELGTNAVTHTGTGKPGGRFVVELEVHPAHLWVAVVDMGAKTEPTLTGGDPSSPAQVNGRGLFLVEALSAKWGTELLGSGRRVWAELACGA
ncbi:MAG TPA: ATP-binding protein [Actinobacteria bacterium]|nr:ATP-binding protein [Actinomycetota bacterium]